MRKMARSTSGFVALALFLAVGATLALTAASPAAPSQAASPPVSCTIWRAASRSLAGPSACTFSDPWWQSWSDCPITPVHAEHWLLDGKFDQGLLSDLPWVQAAPASAGIIGHLFYGNRPLPVPGSKVLWQFADAVTDVHMTATNLWEKQPPIAITGVGAANTGTNFATQWPSSVTVPKAGCWRVDISAKDANGHPVRGSVTFIAVK